MQTHLAPAFQDTPEGRTAEAVLRQCVHCGFCNATCPTHRLLGDELDGPRGRIYLMKQVFEGAPVTRLTQEHLDRCIGCRHCETTCPSGVRYSELYEVGTRVVDAAVPRTPRDRALRWLLRRGLTSPLFKPALRLGRALRPWLPGPLQQAVPPAPALGAPAWPTAEQQALHTRQVVLLKGCVQPGLRPHIDAATARVLDACGVRAVVVPGSGCCGAIQAHLGDRQGALERMRRNIDAWWPWMEGQAAGQSRGKAGVRAEALVLNASGCGAMVKEYGHWLADDPEYAERARRISAWAQDLGEWLPQQAATLQRRLSRKLRPSSGKTPGAPDTAPLGRITYHPPCSLSHAQQRKGEVEALLRSLGFDVQLAANDPLQCCGAGGAYNVLHPEIARGLRDEKLRQLDAEHSAVVASANIGCITHLQSGTRTPVKHWIELVDEALSG